ncbi:MAG: pseudouridine synthase [Clostridia bacterium]|nr:pseudouridine synthase [Clostridia bacterium]
MRINKYLALCGVAGRRGAEKFIKQGKVSVNGKIINEFAVDVDEKNDVVRFDGKILNIPQSFTYIMLNKPKGYICSNSDEKGRKTVFDLIQSDKRLFTVGRLDYDTEGLLIITDDGALCKKLTHPSNEIGKTYIVKIDGKISENALAALRNGVILDDGFKTSESIVKILKAENDSTRIEISIHEGHNRQIKRMFGAVGKQVVFLKRVSVGNLRLGGLKRGEFRHLKKREILEISK